MLNSDVLSAAIIRSTITRNPDGTMSDTQDCNWIVVHNIVCGLLHNKSNSLVRNKEFEVSTTREYLTFDMKDQNFTVLDILLTDYLAVSYNGLESTIKMFKVVSIIDENTICGCSIKLELERITPRDCGITTIECSKLITPEIYDIN